MKRRKFLTLAGVSGLIGAFASFRFISVSFEKAAVSIIKDELGFLSLDIPGVEKFVNEFTKNKGDAYKWAIKGYSFLGISSSRSGKIHQLVNEYLLSTDFFINKMDESRTIKYIGLYDPYMKPCQHPFNHIHYPGTDT